MNGILYIGNLNYTVTETQLGKLFSQYGDVESVKILDQKGYGFVVMAKAKDALNAIKELNDKYFESRKIIVNEVYQKTRELL